MGKIKFYKYHGTGNDFIMIDNRSQKVKFDSPLIIAELCHRRFGIGADGLILLESSVNTDFRMKYYNADGHEGSMCGNGGRCILAFAKFLGMITEKATFEAIDGIHRGEFRNSGNIIALKMNDVNQIERDNGAYILNTGSPHYVAFSDNTGTVDVLAEGKKIRFSDRYKAEGINVNFVGNEGPVFSIRTYERGVEDETHSCGTGTVAAALALESAGKTNSGGAVKFESKGGLLEVNFKRQGNFFTDIWLIGPVQQVFEGTIELT